MMLMTIINSIIVETVYITRFASQVRPGAIAVVLEVVT